MSIATRIMNTSFVRHRAHLKLGIAFVLIGAPISAALADPGTSAESEVGNQSIQSPAIDPITGLAYGAQTTVSGVAMAVDAEGHPRALCADPADSLSPLKMRDAIDPTTSRLRYE